MTTEIITEQDYKNHLGVDTAPSNLMRLEFISLETFKAIPITHVPEKAENCFDNFKKALIEQINFFELNEDLLTQATSESGFSLGKFSEGSKERVQANDVMNLISPITYKILLNCYLIYAGLSC